MCHSCSVSNTIANRPVEIQKEINAKMQASRKPHLQEINNKISYKLSHRTEEEKRLSFEKRQQTCLEKYGGISPMCSTDIQNKQIKTYIENNGGMGFASKNVQEKFKKNYKEKYGVIHSSQNPIVRKKQASKYKFENINFDSKPEIEYYIWLRDNNINFEYQPNVKFEYSYNGKIHYYIPDFKINEEFIELKGLHFFKNYDTNEVMINPFNRTLDEAYEAKHQCMIKNNVKIITDFSEFENYVNEKYGKDYIKQFKRD